MTNALTTAHYNYVAQHLNQTMLVYELLKSGFLSYDDIRGAYDPETEEFVEIFQWLAFPRFYGCDLDKLAEAGIPVLESEYGDWVGITSFGSHYDLYVYPALINAIFDMDISYDDIQELGRVMP
ncbi:hypothetical protein A6A05_19355 [Magnetospirillum moscoviense]|uniref:Uncharacterized protein n=2 Tax=Magnetospirillum moscoviense TaxID=1437059 RepID=A0A178MY75_9PROT|nr:hypothetical protein A6A05_19355 [Magnetospirillum moscoviense]